MTPSCSQDPCGSLYWRGGFVLILWTLCYQNLHYKKKKKIQCATTYQSIKIFIKVWKVKYLSLRRGTILDLILSEHIL